MKTISTIILLLLAFSHTTANASDTPSNVKEYDVEIIIFEDAHARYINSEIWSQNTNDAANIDSATGNLDNQSTKQINATSYRSIKPYILKKDYERIKNSSEYNVLFYGAWRQAGLDKNEAFEIEIEDLGGTHKAKSGNTISGQLKLVLSRYLHIYGDLDYQRPIDLNSIASESSDDTTIKTENTYPITMHRRMRSKELHYIDHPLVGILIKINPVDKPAVENTEKTKKEQ